MQGHLRPHFLSHQTDKQQDCKEWEVGWVARHYASLASQAADMIHADVLTSVGLVSHLTVHSRAIGCGILPSSRLAQPGFIYFILPCFDQECRCGRSSNHHPEKLTLMYRNAHRPRLKRFKADRISPIKSYILAGSTTPTLQHARSFICHGRASGICAPKMPLRVSFGP